MVELVLGEGIQRRGAFGTRLTAFQLSGFWPISSMFVSNTHKFFLARLLFCLVETYPTERGGLEGQKSRGPVGKLEHQ